MTKTISTILTLLLLANLAGAVELQLRSECRPKGSVVLLGEVAEIMGADAEQTSKWSAIELCPAPAAGGKRVLRAREVQDLLELRGIGARDYRLSGASQVTWGGSENNGGKLPRATIGMTKLAQKGVEEAILNYLKEQAPGDQPWEIESQLEDEQVRLLSNATGTLMVEGGTAPWTGKQQFFVTAEVNGGLQRLNVKAKVTLPPTVVVTTHSLLKGSILRTSDVQLRWLSSKLPANEAYQKLEDVIGQETTRAAAEGQVLDAQYVRRPLWVKKGDVVTVYVRADGIKIRTNGRSREEGSSGDVIAVDSLLERKPFYARVTGLQEVEVMARAMSAVEAPAAPVASIRK